MYLIKTVETYRCADSNEAETLIRDSKNSSTYTLLRYSSEDKCIKVKGEIEDEWKRVTLTKVFTEEKDPDRQVTVDYGED